ncbi:MAG TPA: hypothetical protein VK050_11215 [Flavobacteriaceae bacterium]|nr:hypothetical protein [Flavobacteriaceae bacterium]
MKKHIILAASLLGIGSLYAQNIDDALRYSQSGIYGNARYTAMSGAFSALGGNLSAINDNPASSAVLLKNNIDFSVLISDNKAKSNFNNTLKNSYYTDLQVANAGINLVYYNWDESSVWNKFTLGANYKLDNAYGLNSVITGVNDFSLSDYFVDVANGIRLELLNLRGNESYADLYSFLGENYGSNAQTAFLGYQGYLINPVDPDNPENTEYVSNISGNAFEQQKSLFERGYQGTFAFNLGTQLIDDLYLGLNLNSHVIDYERKDVFEEIPHAADSNVDYVAFKESLRTYGSGFSAQLGAIYRLENGMRFGLTYSTPKWTRIEEETQQSIETDYFDNGSWYTAKVNPKVLNVFEKYTIRTPGKAGASFAYVFGTDGLISLQYEYTNNANIRFKPRSNSFFATQNDIIKDALQASSNIRIGGEYNIAFASLRGGLHYLQSPYKDSKLMGDTKGFSVGFGFIFENINLDFAYLQSSQETNNLMLPTSSNTYRLDKTQKNFIISLGVDI